MTFKQYRRRSS